MVTERGSKPTRVQRAVLGMAASQKTYKYIRHATDRNIWQGIAVWKWKASEGYAQHPQGTVGWIQITKALKLVDEEYNIAFMHKYDQHELLKGMEWIFSCLDADGDIYWRTSQVMFLFMALILTNQIALRDNTMEDFLSQFNEFQNDINQV
jgi:hypothetical protein